MKFFILGNGIYTSLFLATEASNWDKGSSRASQVALVVKNPVWQCRRCKRPRFSPWVRKIPLEEGMACTPWRLLLSGESHRQRSLVTYSPKGHKELDSHALQKEMATHSSVLAWRIPGMWEPGGLPSMGLHRVGHNRKDLAAASRRLSTHTHARMHTHSS